jgi:hypothetical protein
MAYAHGQAPQRKICDDKNPRSLRSALLTSSLTENEPCVGKRLLDRVEHRAQGLYYDPLAIYRHLSVVLGSSIQVSPRHLKKPRPARPIFRCIIYPESSNLNIEEVDSIAMKSNSRFWLILM